MAYQRPEYDDMAPRLNRDRDAPINVHEGCTLLPFAIIQLGDYDPFKIRYTIGSLLELEQTFNRSLWVLIEQALLGTLGEEEQSRILQKGLQSRMDIPAILNTLERPEVIKAFKQSQVELQRATGQFEIEYNENGEPVSVKPRVVDSYKRADVRDAENFALKKPKLETFGQWYELALNTLFQMGVTIPINEILNMMPRELEAFFTAHDKRLVYLQQKAMFEAWHAGAFTGKFISDGKLPDLEPMLRRIARQSDKETKSKFTKEEAQAIINSDKAEAEEAERMLKARKPSDTAKQSDTVEK